MTKITFLDNIADDKISFAVIMARYHSQWLYCKHKMRDTYEAPGGKRMQNETIEEMARRELYEETAAEHYVLFQIARYCMETDDGTRKYGVLYFAELTMYPKSQLIHEIERVELFPNNTIPKYLTYPEVQMHLIAKVSEWLEEREYELTRYRSVNPFSEPKSILDEIEKNVFIVKDKQKRYNGKAFMALFLTRYCSLECRFCIYHSVRRENDGSAYNEFNTETVKNAIRFINSSNHLSYLLIAGGGEPFECYDSMVDCIRYCRVPKIVIATNAMWGQETSYAQKCIQDISEAVDSNPVLQEFVIRISVDRWHFRRNTLSTIVNVLSAVQKYGRDKIRVEFHTIQNDKTVATLCNRQGWDLKNQAYKQADSSGLAKISPAFATILTKDGTSYKVVYAKLFHPNLFCNLADKEFVQRAVRVYDDDLVHSQFGNFSLVQNHDGTVGLDWLLNYNGNITTWCNYQLNQSSNIHRASYEEILDELYRDPISYFHLHSSVKEREKIVMEVDPVAVLRSEVINVRDYSAAYMLYEDKTRLFFALYIIKKYYREGLILEMPDKVKAILEFSMQTLKYMYAVSRHTIIDQIATEADKNPLIWKTFLLLIKNGHFAVPEEDIDRTITHIGSRLGVMLCGLDDCISLIQGDAYQCLTSILTATPEV